MNSVASNMVATMMNSNYGVNQSTSVSSRPTSNGFSEIFNQSKTRHLNKEAFDAYAKEHVGVTESSTDQVDVQDTVNDVSDKHGQKIEEVKVDDTKAETVVEDEKAVSEVPEDGDEDKLQTLKEAIESLSETEKTSEALDERLEKVEELMLDFVSQFLGISQDQLQTMMTDLGMTPLELMQMESFSTLVADFYGLDSFSELLVHEEASTVIKEISGEMESLLQTLADELDMNVDELKGELEAGLATVQALTGDAAALASEADKATQTTELLESQTTEVESTDTSVKVEVLDERSGQDTTEYSGGNTGKEDQSFANILSNNTNVSKEFIVINNGEQVVYKEINPQEIIDQIVTKAVVKLTDTNTTMQMQLNPGHLGKIAVSVTTEQGLVKGQFIAESQAVKEMLEANIGQLKTQLESQGVKVEKIEVTVGNSGQFFEQNKEQQQHTPKEKANRARINRLSRMRSLNEVIDSIESIDDAHWAGRPVILDSLTEHTVDYSA